MGYTAAGKVEVEVRRATAADRDAIAEVEQSGMATLRETYRPRQAAIAHRQALADQLTRLVAVDGSDVVGTVEYSLESDRLHFLSLLVHSHYRRRGVAKQIVAALKDIAAAAGANCLSTYTVKETGNPRIFERLGFSVVSEELSDIYESDHLESVTETYLELPIHDWGCKRR